MEISKQEYYELYYYMVLGRTMEERLEILYKQGKIPSAIYLGRGQEASEVGTSFALSDGDVLAPTHRDVIAQLPRGMEVKRIFAQHFGKVTSPTRGKGEATYLGDIKLGIFTSISMLPDVYPVAAGAALAFKLRKESRVAMAYCGEGATNRGDFHEAVNFASVLNLPVVFVVINNHYAYSTPTYREMLIKDVGQRAICYGIPGLIVDGNDVIEVYKTSKEVVERARNGGGPTLIECKTMRMKGHAGHDPMNYVPIELLQEWEARDPVDMFRRFLTEGNYLSEEEFSEIDQKVENVVEEGVRFAEESSLPEGEEALAGVYSS